jgi:hypothetical protein
VSRHTPGRTGPLAHWYRRATREFLAANPVCWICGHGGCDGPTGQNDHAIPVSKAPELAYEPTNWRPSHGWGGCPTCGEKCNQLKGDKLERPTISPRSRRW